jgi:triosephosphate isomerase
MAGNWKMYKTVHEARGFAETLIGRLKAVSTAELPDIVICPPYTVLNALHELLVREHPPIVLGAQNVESRDEGAYTGEISLRMLMDFDVRYVIIGHSERREYYHETDESVNAKIGAALRHGLTPIICVGESLQQREAAQTDAWVQKQVNAALVGFSEEQRRKVLFAYEPIWAIGTGKVCEAPEANRVIGLIRQVVGILETRILYGGSMKPDNVEGLMAQPEIDGGLVGGASLDPESFFKLIQAAMPLKV